MTTEVDALQATLTAEHAAVYVYGLLGSRTSQTAEPELYLALRAAYEAHRDRRDTLTGEIAALAATPTPAEFIRFPARMKNGTANSGKLSTPAIIRCAMMTSGATL